MKANMVKFFIPLFFLALGTTACSDDNGSTDQGAVSTTRAPVTTTTEPPPEIFTMVVAATISNADQAVSEGKPSSELTPLYSSTLVEYEKPAEGSDVWPSPSDVVASVAASYTQTDAGYRFVLGDAVSPYGNAVTSADVEWSFDRVLANDGTGYWLMMLGTIDLEEPIEVVDDRTFILRVTDPGNPYAIGVLTYHHFGILDSVEAQKHSTEDDPWASDWLSTSSASFGAYQLASIVPGESLRLTQNPNWSGSPLDIDEIVVRAVPEASARLVLVSSGEADFADKLALDQFAAIQGHGDLQTIAAPGNTTVPLVLNSEYEPFADARVRAAISAAIDRDALVAGPMHGMAKPALFQLLSEIPQPPPPGPAAAQDLARARELLEEAGYGGGFDFTLTVNSVRPGPFSEDLAVVLQSQLAEIGIKVKIEVASSSADFQSAIYARSMQAWIGSQTPGISDPQFPWVLVHHSTKAFENSHGYSNPRVDEIIDVLSTTQRGPERDALITEGHAILLEEVPWVPLVEMINPITLGSEVESFRMDIFRRVVATELSKR